MRIGRRAVAGVGAATVVAGALAGALAVAVTPGHAPALPATTTDAAVSATTVETAATSGAVAPDHTTVGYVSPVTPDGALAPGYRVVHRGAGAQCTGGSEAIGAGYRCFAGNAVVDPCWLLASGHDVACLPSAFSRSVTELHVDRFQFPHLSQERGIVPFGVTLTTGERCAVLQGASSTADGRRVADTCGHDVYLAGAPDSHHEVWTLHRVSPIGRTGRFRDDGLARIASALYGVPSRSA